MWTIYKLWSNVCELIYMTDKGSIAGRILFDHRFDNQVRVHFIRKSNPYA